LENARRTPNYTLRVFYQTLFFAAKPKAVGKQS
jgi:hypothetical protein